MASCIEKLPHSCGSSDGLQVFEEGGKYDGFCFACQTYVADPYGDKPKGYKPQKIRRSPEEIAKELDEIDGFKCVDLPDRALEKWALEYFGIKIGVSEEDGETPILHYYPYTKDGQRVAYKTRLIEGKRLWCVGSMKGVDLFGWQQALASGAKRLMITEGECDAVALLQALVKKQRGTKWENYYPAVVSLTSGASSAKADLTANLAAIRANFQEVVLVFDQDEAGRAAAEAALQVLPTARTVTLPSKDANQCLLDGRQKALCDAVLFKAQTPKNTRLVNASSLFEAARKPAEWGLSWPWDGLTRMTRGIRFGETYYLGAGVKMGKSEMVNAIGAHLMVEHNLPILMAKPEEANNKTVKLMAGKIAGRIFHDPNIPFDEDAYDAATAKIGDKLWLINLYQHLGWESLRNDVMVAAAEGCKAVFIDPITNLTNGVVAGDANTMLQDIAQELAAMAKDLNIVVFIFCHLKAPLTGDPHERGGKVLSHQFAGSRAMMRSCNLMLGLEGNKDPDLSEEQRNMRRLVILEDREFGASGYIDLYWDQRTSLFNEVRK